MRLRWWKPKPIPTPAPEVTVRFAPDSVEKFDMHTGAKPSVTPEEFYAYGEWAPGPIHATVVVKITEGSTIRLVCEDTKVELFASTDPHEDESA